MNKKLLWSIIGIVIIVVLIIAAFILLNKLMVQVVKIVMLTIHIQ